VHAIPTLPVDLAQQLNDSKKIAFAPVSRKVKPLIGFRSHTVLRREETPTAPSLTNPTPEDVRGVWGKKPQDFP